MQRVLCNLLLWLFNKCIGELSALYAGKMIVCEVGATG